MHDPAMYAATVLAETLQANGVKVSGKADRDLTARAALRSSGDATTLRVLAIHETPLDAVLARANKDSMNLYAEAMCKRLGAEVSGAPGSWRNGTAALASFVQQKCGVPESELKLDDGCGLSKENRISANALARVLAFDFASPNRQKFINSLSVAGSDGTLDRRFKDAPFQDLRGRVFAKSGFVNGVSSLSGFVKAKDDRWYAFSILMNGVGDIATCKQIQEKVVKAIDDAAVSGMTSAR
jgi:D-alanyl-D-alanine carboxypeptidase/D-alanyl-D-alanine-endopeptidase (penicillin-binding protein 4)